MTKSDTPKLRKFHEILNFLEGKNQPKYSKGLQKSRFRRLATRGRKVAKINEKNIKIHTKIVAEIHTKSVLVKGTQKEGKRKQTGGQRAPKIN